MENNDDTHHTEINFVRLESNGQKTNPNKLFLQDIDIERLGYLYKVKIVLILNSNVGQTNFLAFKV